MKRPIVRFVRPFLAMTTVLCLPAVFNQWPLVYSDTGTYLSSGADWGTPPDRPITYGLFLRATALAAGTPWMAVLVQAALCAAVIIRCFQCLAGDAGDRHVLTVVTILSMGSGLGWSASMLLPDVFTGTGIVIVLLLMLAGDGRVWDLFLFLALVFITTVHLSHPMILLAVWMAGLLLIRPILRWRSWLPPLAIITGMALLASVNLRLTGRFELSSGSDLFLLGRTLEIGLLQEELPGLCATSSNFLCGDLQKLPSDHRMLLWDPEGPVQQAGGWHAVRSDAAMIVDQVLFSPVGIWAFLKAGLRDGLEQLTMLGSSAALTDPWYRVPESSPARSVHLYLSGSYPGYLGSRQNTDRLHPTFFDDLQIAVLACSLIAGLWLYRRWPVSRRLLAWSLVSAMLAAVLCAMLSTPDQRFLSRVSWVPCLVVGCMLASRSRSSEQTIAHAVP
ncbi:MAG: hypothetical protein KDB88_05065 [Flavobacteriales bacterium]|nr:hypothetical protein [Flavobacteriales bacterium]